MHTIIVTIICLIAFRRRLLQLPELVCLVRPSPYLSLLMIKRRRDVVISVADAFNLAFPASATVGSSTSASTTVTSVFDVVHHVEQWCHRLLEDDLLIFIKEDCLE